MLEASFYKIILINFSIIAFLVLACVLIFRASRVRIVKEMTEQKNQELRFREELIENIIVTQEEERTRIARELHDDISSKLYVAALNIQLVENQGELNEKSKEHIQSVSKAISTSVERAREIAHNLLPAAIEKYGFVYALEDFVLNINRTDQLKINLNMEGLELERNSLAEIHLFRIFQELINNSLKHAMASTITIDAEQGKENIDFNYKDDGVGFKQDAKEGLGVGNINSRVKILNGSIEKIEATKGVHFLLKIPFSKLSA